MREPPDPFSPGRQEAGATRWRSSPTCRWIRSSRSTSQARRRSRHSSSPWIRRYPRRLVLPGQPQHHRPHLAMRRREPGPAPARHARPPAADDVAVPAQDRAGSDDQPHRHQALRRHRPRQQRQSRPVRPRQTRMGARPLALCHSKLVAQHEVSRRRESHPPPLAEPCGSLSAHTAPIVQPSGLTPNRQWANRSGYRRAVAASSSRALVSRRRSRLNFRHAHRTR